MRGLKLLLPLGLLTFLGIYAIGLPIILLLLSAFSGLKLDKKEN